MTGEQILARAALTLGLLMFGSVLAMVAGEQLELPGLRRAGWWTAMVIGVIVYFWSLGMDNYGCRPPPVGRGEHVGFK